MRLPNKLRGRGVALSQALGALRRQQAQLPAENDHPFINWPSAWAIATTTLECPYEHISGCRVPGAAALTATLRLRPRSPKSRAISGLRAEIQLATLKIACP